MAYRVIQWATGNVGRLAIEAVLAHPDLELVGVWVHSPEKAGRRFGGVEATNDTDEVLGMEADCVIYTPLLGQTAEVARILEGRGVAIGRSLVGSFVTSLDMAGYSLTLLKLDDDLEKLWDAPVKTPALRWGT